MNKAKVAVVVIAGLILGESLALAYFINRSNSLFRKLETIRPGYQKLEQAELALRTKYQELEKENESMKVDRNNLLAQVKSLMDERARANELSTTLEQVNNDLSALEKEKEELKNTNISLEGEIKASQDEIKALAQERDNFKSSYEKARKDTQIKEFNAKISDLEKQIKNSASSLKSKEALLDKAAAEKNKLETENKILESQLKELKKSYAVAFKKNKKLEEAARKLPAKFSEIARQNKRLMKETTQMHYNLGVFYTKNKTYERAIAEFEKVIDLDPSDAYAHFNLGYIYAEYIVNRRKAIEHFRHFLRLAKSNDKDVDWVKKYLLTWETYEGKQPME